MLSIHKKALLRDYKLFPFYQTGEQGSAFHHHYQPEDNKRIRQIVSAPAAVIPKSGGGSGSPAITITRPPAPGLDRWHKEGYDYVTVSKQHLPGEDTVLDPSMKHTWNDGYTEALRLVALMTAAGDSLSRVKMEIFSGEYIEDLICTSDRIDIVGQDLAMLRGSLSVSSACTKILIDNLILHNTMRSDDRFPLLKASLRILAGPESGAGQSDIQVTNCHFTGNQVLLFINRWAYIGNCQFFPNSALFLGNFGAVHVRFGGFPDLTTKWTIFYNCHLRGYNDGSDYRDRLNAISIEATDGLGVWYPNALTYGIHLWAQTGVLLDHCQVDGYSSNVGWNMEYLYTYGIEGWFINGTAGSVHHQIFCNSDVGVEAYTWFNHSRGAVRYLVQTNESGATVGGNFCNVYLSHTKHTLPDGGIQSPQAVIAGSTAGVNANTHVYADYSNTHAQYFFQVPGPAEGALLLLSTSGSDTNSADPGAAKAAFYKQGYINW